MYDIDGTEQEVFDRVVTHFAEQKRIAANPMGTCLYRAGDLKCAAGALIPDDKYDGRMEGHDFCQLLEPFWSAKERQNVGPFFTCNPALLNLITELQLTHDQGRTWSSRDAITLLHAELHFIAEQRKLNPALIDTITEWSK